VRRLARGLATLAGAGPLLRVPIAAVAAFPFGLGCLDLRPIGLPAHVVGFALAFFAAVDRIASAASATRAAGEASAAVLAICPFELADDFLSD